MPEIEKSVVCYINTKVKEIVPKGVICERNGEEFLVEGGYGCVCTWIQSTI